jgi:hypothetical protein
MNYQESGWVITEAESDETMKDKLDPEFKRIICSQLG